MNWHVVGDFDLLWNSGIKYEQVLFLGGLTIGVSLSELRELVIDREAWRAAIHGVVKSQTRLSDWTELNWLLAICNTDRPLDSEFDAYSN